MYRRYLGTSFDFGVARADGFYPANVRRTNAHASGAFDVDEGDLTGLTGT